MQHESRTTLRIFLYTCLSATLVLGLVSPAAWAHDFSTVATESRDSVAVVAAVDAYHRALSTADSVAALALLADDAIVLESGTAETRAEYRSHHLQSDIEFPRAVPSVRGPVRVVVNGDVAWATSTSTTQGEFRGRPINAAGAELMVLVRTAAGWKISAIHWSSRTRRQ